MTYPLEHSSTCPDLITVGSDDSQTVDFLVDVVRFSLPAFQTGGFPDGLIDKTEHFD